MVCLINILNKRERISLRNNYQSYTNHEKLFTQNLTLIKLKKLQKYDDDYSQQKILIEIGEEKYIIKLFLDSPILKRKKSKRKLFEIIVIKLLVVRNIVFSI